MKHTRIIQKVIVILMLITIGVLTYIYIKTAGDEKNIIHTNAKKISQLSLVIKSKEDNIRSLNDQIKEINNNYSNLQNNSTAKKVQDLQSQIDNINSAFSSYNSLPGQISQAKTLGINITEFNNLFNSISGLLLAQKYSDALTLENTLNTSLTNAINQAKATPTSTVVASTPAPQNLAGSSFNTTTVNTQGKSFSVYYVSIDLKSPGLKITTDTADSNDCGNNCNVMDLMTFYNRNHGFAAINGTYFCPATYPSCQGKINSYDFPVYNSNSEKWINQPNLFWVNRAMLTFDSSNNFKLYSDASTYSNAPIRAGFVNAPGLIKNRQIIVGSYPLDTKSSTAQITRGAIGINGNNLIIADAFSATVPQMAYIMQSLGTSDAINIDGGGSTAMVYNGQYKLGPGRNIPNAIVFSRN